MKIMGVSVMTILLGILVYWAGTQGVIQKAKNAVVG